MFMSLPRIIIIWFLLLFNACSFAADPVLPLSEKIIDNFFTSLSGNWDGRAIETPIGPVDYAINFYSFNKGGIAGVAKLGVSNHHWRFWRADGELRLTFLSTFRGNQKPTQLVLSKIEENTFHFYAPKLALLTLSVTINEPNVDIRVFHHQKPHVYIRLTRSDTPVTKEQNAKTPSQ